MVFGLYRACWLIRLSDGETVSTHADNRGVNHPKQGEQPVVCGNSDPANIASQARPILDSIMVVRYAPRF